MRTFWKRLLTPPLLVAATVFLGIEELQWRLAAVYALIARLPVLRQGEAWVRTVRPYPALLLLALPALALAPIKLLALYWLAGGHPTLGLATILGAKVAGTAFVARLYQLTRPALTSIGWFAWGEAQVLRLRRAAYDLWRNSAAVRWLRPRWQAWRQRVRAAGRGWFTRRWSAMRARLRPQL